MKKTLPLLALSFLGVVGSPLISHAATYNYLDINGTVHSVDAPSATQALTFINSLDSTLHSGIALDLGLLNPGDDYGNDYQYRTIYGTNAVVHAATFDAARILAVDRAPTSGLLLLD